MASGVAGQEEVFLHDYICREREKLKDRVEDIILERDRFLDEAKGIYNSITTIETAMEPLGYPITFLEKEQRLVQVVVDKNETLSKVKRSLEVTHKKANDLEKALKETWKDHLKTQAGLTSIARKIFLIVKNFLSLCSKVFLWLEKLLRVPLGKLSIFNRPVPSLELKFSLTK